MQKLSMFGGFQTYVRESFKTCSSFGPYFLDLFYEKMVYLSNLNVK